MHAGLCRQRCELALLLLAWVARRGCVPGRGGSAFCSPALPACLPACLHLFPAQGPDASVATKVGVDRAFVMRVARGMRGGAQGESRARPG